MYEKLVDLLISLAEKVSARRTDRKRVIYDEFIFPLYIEMKRINDNYIEAFQNYEKDLASNKSPAELIPLIESDINKVIDSRITIDSIMKLDLSGSLLKSLSNQMSEMKRSIFDYLNAQEVIQPLASSGFIAFMNPVFTEIEIVATKREVTQEKIEVILDRLLGHLTKRYSEFLIKFNEVKMSLIV